MKKKVLILSPQFDRISPRSIRTENIFGSLSSEYELHLLKFNHPKKKRTLKDSTIHALEISKFSSYFINHEYSNSRIIHSQNILRKIITKLYTSIFLFPDLWKIELKNILRYFRAREDKVDFDFIVASIKPFSSAKLALELKKIDVFKNSKILFDIGDPLTNDSADPKSNSRKHNSYESSVMSKSDHIIVTNVATKSYFCDKYNIEENKFSVIPQGVNLKLFKSVNLKINKPSHNGIKMIYAGVFIKKLREPDHFISALHKINDPEKYQVLFYGADIKPNYTFNTKGKVPQSKLVAEYNSSDVLIFFDNAFGIQTSGKIFELLALKKPILFIYSNTESSLVVLAKKYPNVIFVENEKDKIYNTLIELPDILKKIAIANYSVDDFSWVARAKLFKSIFQTLN